MNKKTFAILLTSILNLTILFSVFVLFVIGFGTSPRIDCAHELNSAKEIEEACRNHIPFFHKMFMVEIFIGLLIIVISNYFIFKSISNKPILFTIITSVLYLIIIGAVYNYFYNDYIYRNIVAGLF